MAKTYGEIAKRNAVQEFKFLLKEREIVASVRHTTTETMIFVKTIKTHTWKGRSKVRPMLCYLNHPVLTIKL